MCVNCYIIQPRKTVSVTAKPDKYRVREQIATPVRKVITDVTNGIVPWPLLFTGDVGSGKTCAALCMVDVYGGVHFNASEWCEQMTEAKRRELFRRGFADRTIILPSELRAKWRSAPLAVLDEIGMRERPSDHELETVKNCLDDREGWPTVFVSNLSLESLAMVYDERIASRLGAGTIVALTGDRRMEPSNV